MGEVATIDIESFRWRLAETITTCGKHMKVEDPEHSLRPSWLRPPAFWYTSGSSNSYDPVDMVEALAALRRYVLKEWGIRDYPDQPATNLSGGRLLIYFPYANLADGAAEAHSGGFFNWDNEPPWDTWLYFLKDREDKGESYRSYLLCWVPPEFLDLASEGIRVNPEVCIQWATEIDTPFMRQLDEAGLLG